MARVNIYEKVRQAVNGLIWDFGAEGVFINGEKSAFVSKSFITAVIFDAGLLFEEMEESLNGKTIYWEFKAFRNYKDTFKLTKEFLISNIGNYKVGEVDLGDYNIDYEKIKRFLDMFNSVSKIELSHEEVKRLFTFLKNNKPREYITITLTNKGITFTFEDRGDIISYLNISKEIKDIKDEQRVLVSIHYLIPYLKYFSKIKGEPLIFGIKANEPLHLKLKNYAVHGIIAPRIEDN